MVSAPSSVISRLALYLALFAVALAGYPVPEARAAEAEPIDESEAEEDVSSRPDSVSAMVTARVADKRIEDLSQRTETTQVFANPDGSWTSEASTGPVRVQDEESGEWSEIDTTLTAVDGGIAPTAAIGDLVLSSGGDKTFAAMDVEGRELEWRWPTALPEPTLDGATATYADVVDNGDLVVTATASGFRHDIVLREAPEDPVSFSVPVVTGGGPKVREDAEDGTLAVKTGDGTELVTAPKPVMYDSSTDEQGDPAEILPVETAITQTASGSVIKLSPDQEFLADPETEYPVTVDPVWDARPSGDAYVSSRTPDTNYGDTDDLRVGTPNEGTHKARSFIRFNPAGEPWMNPAANATITNAQLTLNNIETYTCSGGPVNVSRLTSVFYAQSITWNSGQPTATADGRATSSVARGMTGCAAADVSWNVTAMVQAWADGAEAHGFQVKGVDETATNTWRRYRSANATTSKPVLTVDYNRPPATPTGISISPLTNNFTSTTQPRLSATVTDPDGGTAYARFEIYAGTAASGTPTYIATGSTVTSGGVSTVVVPAGVLSNGGTYTVRAFARDALTWSGVTAATAPFTVDTTAYSATVTASAYTNGQWLDNKPSSNTFTLNGPNAVTRFSILQDGLSSSVTANASGDASLSWNPTAGAHRLEVTPISRSGVAGPKVTFNFGNGTSALTQPANGDRSSSTFPVLAGGPPNATSAKLQWRFAPTGTTPDPNAGWSDATSVAASSSPGTPWTGSVTSSAAGSTTPSLVWDARADVEVPSGASALVEVRVVFSYSGGATKASSLRRVSVVPHAFGGSFPTSSIGPGEVALSTGEFQLSQTDVSVPGYISDLSIGRTHLSAGADATGAAGVFGPGWVADLEGPGEGVSGYAVHDRTSQDGSINLVAPTGESYLYRHSSGTRGAQQVGAYLGVGEAELTQNVLDLKAVTNEAGVTHRLVVTAGDGAVTQFVRTSGGSWVVELVKSSGDTTTTRYEFNGAGLVTWIFAPVPAGVSCNSANQTAGCRALRLNYSGTGAATRLASVDLRIWDPKPGTDGLPSSSAGMTTVAVAKYSYDSSGRLVSSWDPRVADGTGALRTSYTYATVAGRVALQSLTEPGLRPWTMHYASTGADVGKLTKVSRPQDAATGGADAAWTVRYDVGLSGTGRPDLRPSASAAWGQLDVDAPASAAAVFGPDHAAASDWSYAAISYWTESRRLTNSAEFGAGEWLVDSRRYDEYGNVDWQLGASGRKAALATPGGTAASAAAANRLATQTIFSEDGRRAEEAWSPESTFVRENGDTITGRTVTETVYDGEPESTGFMQGRPTGSDVPNGGFNVPVRELTSTTTSAPGTSSPVLFDTKEIRYRYDPVQTGDGDGWKLRNATRVLEQDGSGWVTSSTRFDTEGKVLETRTPESNASTGTAAATRTRRTVYYTHDAGSPLANCKNKPQWVGLTCWTGPAAQPAVTPGIPESEIQGYSTLLSPTRNVETSGSSSRVAVSRFDGAGRQVSVGVVVAGVPDDLAVPAAETTYSASTGLPTSIDNGASVQATSYDTWGRVVRYADGNGNIATTSYDAAGRLATINDGKGVYSYTYNGTDLSGKAERRGLVTGLDVGVSGGHAPMRAAYDANGDLVREQLLGGIEASWDRDEAGQPSGLTYTRADGTGISALASFAATRDRDGRVRTSAGPFSVQNYQYDMRDRLSMVQDIVNGSCTTRVYNFSPDSNRTSVATFAPGVASGQEGDCRTTGTAPGDEVETSSYDDADRIQNSGYDYDSFGRTLTAPAIGGNEPAGAGSISLRYHSNDMVARISQSRILNGSPVTFQQRFSLDVMGRTSEIVESADDVDMRTEKNFFSGPTDSPSWSTIQMRDSASSSWQNSWERYVVGIGGRYAILQSSSGQLTAQLSNIHGDIVAQATLGEPGLSAYAESTEYGVPRNQEQGISGRYGWLGSERRHTGGIVGGMSLMGARLYSPAAGKFSTRDAVVGGNHNAYTYPVDPVNQIDLTGMRMYQIRHSWCRNGGCLEMQRTCNSKTERCSFQWGFRWRNILRQSSYMMFNWQLEMHGTRICSGGKTAASGAYWFHGSCLSGQKAYENRGFLGFGKYRMYMRPWSALKFSFGGTYWGGPAGRGTFRGFSYW